MSKSRDLADLPAGSGNIDINGGTIDGVTIGGASAGAAVDFRVESDTETHALFVDGSSNNVGIQVSNPAAPLEVSTSSADYRIQLTHVSGQNLIKSVDGDQSTYRALIYDGLGHFFRVSGSEAARIDSGGKVQINTTAPITNAMLTILPQDVSRIICTRSFNTTAQFHQAFQNNSGSDVGNILVSTTSTAYNTSSDYRLKENVVDMTDAIDRLKALPVHRFNFIVDPDTTVDGFLAHEAQEIVPEAVTGEKDQVEAIGNITDAEGIVVQEGVTEPTELPEGQTWTKTGERPVMQGIDQAKLVPLLTGALKEAIARIETLEAEVATLKGN